MRCWNDGLEFLVVDVKEFRKFELLLLVVLLDVDDVASCWAWWIKLAVCCRSTADAVGG